MLFRLIWIYMMGVSRYLCNGLAIVYNRADVYFNWKYGIANSSNKIVLPITYAEIKTYNGFSEDLCSIALSETYMGETVYEYIDKYGNMAIPFEYVSADNFSNGVANVWVEHSSSSVVINKENEIVSVDIDTPMYSLTDYCDYFENEYYTGGIKNNKTGQIVDISEFKILPIIVGEKGECVIGFSND